MATVVQADRVHVLQRLRDLRDWARFIHESISEDQPFESGKRRLLAAYMGDEFLQKFSEDSASIVDRLDVMITNIMITAVPADQVSLERR